VLIEETAVSPQPSFAVQKTFAKNAERIFIAVLFKNTVMSDGHLIYNYRKNVLKVLGTYILYKLNNKH
jgi:hypothetical protein